MNYIGKFISNFKDFYNDINSATLTGAIDVIVIKQPDGTYACSPFHVRFGKIGVLRSREKVVDIEVNGQPVNIHMKLGESGEAFFVEEVESEHEIIPVHLATSPLPAIPDIGAELQKLKFSEKTDSKESVTFTTGYPSDNEDVHNNGVVSTGAFPPKNAGVVTNSQQTVTFSPMRRSRGGQKDPKSNKSSDDSDNLDTVEKNVNLNFHEVSAPSDAADADDGHKMKRKKKKRISGKKRVKSREVNIPSSVNSVDKQERNIDEILKPSEHIESDSCEKPEDIFQMDNDYVESDEDEGYPCLSSGLSRSVSLPVNCNKSCEEWPIRKMSSTFTGEFHPFSDGDVTPQSSPTGSRPPSPKSDTEYENQKLELLEQDSNEPSWGWGQLPNVPNKKNNSHASGLEQGCASNNSEDPNKGVDSDEAEKRSMLGGMLNFMRSTKKYRHMPESEGIYLDSINTKSLDPEVAALYFPKFRSAYIPATGGNSTPPFNDEDTESGKGPSLPHSPHSVEGAIGGPSSQDSDNDDRHFSFGCYNDVALSLCGGPLDADADFPEEKFQTSLVSYEEFTENPSLLLNPNLVMRVGGKYYNWQTAAPMIVSAAAFQRLLPEKTRNQLINEHMPKKKKSKSYSSWWSWRRTEADTKQEAQQLESVIAMDPASEENENKSSDMESMVEDVMVQKDELTPTTEAAVIGTAVDGNVPSVGDGVLKEEETCENVKDELQTTRKEFQLTLNSATSSECSTPMCDASAVLEAKDELVVPSSEMNHTNLKDAKDSENIESKGDNKEKYKKSLRLTSEQISSLNLHGGPNEVVFSVTTAYQGTTRCKCDIYLWNYDEKIVISDIDGTITKSDVLGHILPMVGKDWAQFGVAKLFTKVKENGYQFLYLSARAIGQARTTRDYLRSIRQGEVCLPDGPLLLSPTSLMNALHREVIEKKPEVFKISCLKDIQTLYPPYMGNPFYAGFGNKINDTWAYRAVGIPTTRIFTINHRGELRLELIQTFQSSYTRLSDQVDHIFPPLNSSRQVNGRLTPSFTASEEFSYFTYWREPIRSVSDEDELSD